MDKDYYQLLGISRHATEKEIKAAYRSKALQLHPDRNPGNQQAEREFRAVTDAYQVLRHARRREVYDSLQAGETPASTSYSRQGRPSAFTDDQFDQWLRRWMKEHGYGREGEEQARRQRTWESRAARHAAQMSAWEEEKREARLQKVRDFRMRQKVADARAARQAATLKKFWQSSPGLIWQDGVMLSVLTAFTVVSAWVLWPSPQAVEQAVEPQIALVHNSEQMGEGHPSG